MLSPSVRSPPSEVSSAGPWPELPGPSVQEGLPQASGDEPRRHPMRYGWRQCRAQHLGPLDQADRSPWIGLWHCSQRPRMKPRGLSRAYGTTTEALTWHVVASLVAARRHTSFVPCPVVLPGPAVVVLAGSCLCFTEWLSPRKNRVENSAVKSSTAQDPSTVAA